MRKFTLQRADVSKRYGRRCNSRSSSDWLTSYVRLRVYHSSAAAESSPVQLTMPATLVSTHHQNSCHEEEQGQSVLLELRRYCALIRTRYHHQSLSNWMSSALKKPPISTTSVSSQSSHDTAVGSGGTVAVTRQKLTGKKLVKHNSSTSTGASCSSSYLYIIH